MAIRFSWHLPAAPHGDRKGRPAGGRLRRAVRRLAPTWRASPLRRVVQVACFVVFCWLFCYVCWPYTAHPARVWADWDPISVDEQTGTVLVEAPAEPAEPIAAGTTLYVVDQANPQDEDVIPLRVAAVAGREMTLEPLHREQLEKLSMSFGPWSLREAAPGSWPSHYADDLRAKETVEAEAFLAIDPLVGISTAVAARCWVWSLGWAAVALLICTVIPRGFCGYVCPLGTLIDLFDWTIGRPLLLRRRRPAAAVDRWWVHLKYYLLSAVLIASLSGVLISGYLAAIAVLTRGLAFMLTPLQTGSGRGWHQVPPLGFAHYVSIGLFLAVLALGLLRPRFWCKYVCPSGAVFSLGSFFRLTERKVDSSCTGCGKCVKICPFDAIKPDFTTRTADCTFCQTCGGVCPAGAIAFVPRWCDVDRTAAAEPSAAAVSLPRRSFLATAVGIAAGSFGGAGAAMALSAGRADLDDPAAVPPVRPPGSVPERQFLRLCIRCGECFQACPNDVLQPLDLQQGLDGLWTPQVVADWSGCEPSCNACGQVCPTGAIRALPLEEKRAARMGLAVVDKQTCLPYAGREECRVCADECTAAGYDAIEFIRVGSTEVDELVDPFGDAGFLAPVVLAHKCVGCGICQTRCYAINAAEKGLLRETAVRIEAGQGREDRLMHGSYVTLRESEARERKRQQQELLQHQGDGGYLPDIPE